MQIANVLLFLLSIMHTIQLVASYNDLLLDENKNLNLMVQKKYWINAVLQKKGQIKCIELSHDRNQLKILLGSAKNVKQLESAKLEEAQHKVKKSTLQNLQNALRDADKTWDIQESIKTNLSGLMNTMNTTLQNYCPTLLTFDDYKLFNNFFDEKAITRSTDFIIFDIHNIQESLQYIAYQIHDKVNTKILASIYAFSFTAHYYSQNKNTGDTVLQNIFHKYFYISKEIRKQGLFFEFFNCYVEKNQSGRCNIPVPDQLVDDYNKFIWTERKSIIVSYCKSFILLFLILYSSLFSSSYTMCTFYNNKYASFLYNWLTSQDSWMLIFFSMAVTNPELIQHFKCKRYVNFKPNTNKLSKTIFSNSFTDWNLKAENLNCSICFKGEDAQSIFISTTFLACIALYFLDQEQK